MIATDSLPGVQIHSLLLVDDDVVFCQVLHNALCKRGFSVAVAHNAQEGMQLANECNPGYAVVDLNMPGHSGLALVAHLKALDAGTKTIVLTGYASIATAVEAIKLGAIQYLAKPADADEIVAAFYREAGDPSLPIENRTLSVDRLEWEYLQRVLQDCAGNISAAARRLSMHRRTLQRKLKKHPVKR